MAYQFYKAEVTTSLMNRITLSGTFLRYLKLEKVNYGAGQFVMLDLPIESKIKTRSYSIASAPNGSNELELLISLNEQGLGTPYLFNHVRVGYHLPLSQPAGKFMQPPYTSIDTDVCLICTGTGIAPFRAFLHDIKNRNVPHKNIDLIFGSRYEKDVLYRKEMEELMKELPGFRYITVLSREQNPDYKGEKGYVHAIYEKLYADKRPAMFYLCGWKVMIKEAQDKLQAMGYDKKVIKFELYD